MQTISHSSMRTMNPQRERNLMDLNRFMAHSPEVNNVMRLLLTVKNSMNDTKTLEQKINVAEQLFKLNDVVKKTEERLSKKHAEKDSLKAFQSMYIIKDEIFKLNKTFKSNF